MLLCQEKLNSLVQASPNESVYLETNTNSYVSGETLLYKFYCKDIAQNTWSNLSKVGYIELIDTSKKSIFRQKINLTNGSGHGSVFIGSSIKTGMYKLVGYTLWTLNNPTETTFQKNIIIINPFQRDFPDYFTTSTQNVNSSKEPIKVLNDNNQQGNIASTQKKYTKRQKVICKIENLKPIKGSFSLSVRKKDSLAIVNKSDSYFPIKGIKNNNLNTNNFITPEFRGEIISGKITSKNTAFKTNDIIVSLSIPGNSFYLSNTKTNENGNFNFILDDNTNTSEAIVQILDANRENFIVELDTPKQYINYNTELTFPKTVFFPQSTKKSIEDRSTASQIENNYYEKKKDSIKPSEKNYPFYNSLEKDYFLDDYTRFPSLKETIVEIIPELYYTRSKHSYTIGIRDYDSQNGSLGDALLLADGIPVQNANELFEYDALNILKIAIVNKSYILGPKIYNGVVNIITKNNNYKLKSTGDYIKDVTLNRTAPKQILYNPDYSKETLNRIPDFRHQLYWDPELKEIHNSQEFSFFTSDVIGEFEIILSGFTNDGEPIQLTGNFSVE